MSLRMWCVCPYPFLIIDWRFVAAMQYMPHNQIFHPPVIRHPPSGQAVRVVISRKNPCYNKNSSIIQMPTL